MSTPNLRRRPTSRALCATLPHSLEALDLGSMSPVQTLASLRFLVLSYLAELERHLRAFDFDPSLPSISSEGGEWDPWRTTGELTMDEARQWARTAMDKLREIREDVRKHLPERLSFADIQADLRARLPDFPDFPYPLSTSIDEMRSHLHIPDVRSRFPDLDDMMNTFNDVKTKFHDLDFNQPLTFVPTLSEHLNDLHNHLSSMSAEVPSGLEFTSQFMGTLLKDMIDKVMSSELMTEILAAAPDISMTSISEREALMETKAKEVARAIKRSFEGLQLITYTDLPEEWRNNPFVTRGYR